MNRNKFKGIKEGWRSGLEKSVAQQLDDLGIKYTYEKLTIRYTEKVRYGSCIECGSSCVVKERTYLPDFVLLHNNIIIETKGRFTAPDRRKHLNIQKQSPELDLRFVFSNPNNKITKGSSTTYADWCYKHGFKYAKKEIPMEWIEERF